MQSIKTKIFTSFIAVILIMASFMVGIVLVTNNLVDRYQEINSNIIYEQNLKDSIWLMVEYCYNDFKTGDFTNYENELLKIRELEKILDVKTRTNKDTYASYLGVKNSLNVVIDLVSELKDKWEASGGTSGSSSFFEEVAVKFEFVKQNTTDLILAETQNIASVSQDIQNAQRLLNISIGVTFLFLIISSVIYSLYFAKKITDPLITLSETAKLVASGDFGVNFDTKVLSNRDEIGSLANSFENMIVSLKQKMHELLESEQNTKAKLVLIEEQNEKLDQNKTAMLNLLEDAKILEDELKIEKQSVEKKVEERTKELVEAKDKISEGWMNLQEEKSKLLAAIDALNKAFVMIGVSGDIILVNDNLNKVFNQEKTNWKLSDIQEQLGESFDFVTAYKKNLEEKKKITYDDITFGSRVLQIRFNPVFSDKTGEKVPLGVLAIIGDVTDEKVLARSRDEFFSIASHELRTPLTAIRGNTSMILDYYKEAIKDPELKLMITDMHDASLRLIGIVNDFLDLSRLEQKRMEYKITDIKLKEVVDSVVKDLKATADEKKIQLVSEIPETVVVKADADKLKQVLFNVTGNSLKFTEKGGVTVSSTVQGNFVKVIITDTGKGIPLANQSLLFRKFQQAGSSTITRDGAKGTGLGLYISKLMVEGMGGVIALESSVEGKGSVFTFTLPKVL